MNQPTAHPRGRRRKALAAALIAASAATLGGLSADRVGSDDTVVVSPLVDGAEISWGDATLVDGDYAVSELTFSRKGLTDDQLLRSSFTSLTESDAGRWWTSDDLNVSGGKVSIDGGADGGLTFIEPPSTGSPVKAAALYYTGLIPLSEVASNVSAKWRPVGGITVDTHVQVQIPIYLGSDPVDIYKTAAGSPIYGAHDDDPEAFFLSVNQVQAAGGRTIVADETPLIVSPNQPYLDNLTVPAYVPTSSGHPDAAIYGYSSTGKIKNWRGTLSQFINMYPNARTPGLAVGLSSNSDTENPKEAVITEVTYGQFNWAFTPTAPLPSGNVKVAIADDDGNVLAEGAATSDGSSNSVSVALATPIKVEDIARVAGVMFG
jgi:hypothetical protein